MISRKNIISILPALFVPLTMVSMDQLTLKQPKIITAKLLIDHELDLQKTYLITSPVEYLTKKSRQLYPLSTSFERMPLGMPLVKVMIINDATGEKIKTILPAPQLINCNNGSVIHLNSNDGYFQVTCTYNNALVTAPKYFPEGKQEGTFETQFLSCMNQFYREYVCINHHPDEHQFIQNNILTVTEKTPTPIAVGNTIQIAPGTFAIPTVSILKTTYSHEAQGCGTPERLVRLATNPKTRSNGYSTFNYVMNRQQRNKAVPRLRQTQLMEQNRLECYCNYLENVKSIGNKSPMTKTVHSSKSPSIDPGDHTPMTAEGSVLEENLENILQNCLNEFEMQNTSNNNRPHHRSDLIGNECLIL